MSDESIKYVDDYLLLSFTQCHPCGHYFCSMGRNVTSYGSTREAQLSSLRIKIHEHKNSQAHKEAINIIETAKKDVLLNLNAQSEQLSFNPLLEFSEQHIVWQKITNLSQTLKV